MNFIKAIAMTTVSVLLLSNVVVFASEYKGLDNKYLNVNNQTKEYVKSGEIEEVNKNTIKIGSRSNKSIFRITSFTKITDEKDNIIEVSELKKGMNVEITYNKVSENSNNKSQEAISIKVERNFSIISSAIIEEILTETSGSQIVTIGYETIDSKDRIIENTLDLVVDKNTEIVNQFGINSEYSELKPGMTVYVEHSKEIIKGYVSQAYSYKINIIKENENSKVLETTILEKNIYNNTCFILVGDSKKENEQLELILSDKTKLKDQYGKNITFDNLKVGQKVKIEHSIYSTGTTVQVKVFSIQILDNKDDLLIENATVENVDIKNNNITINYKVQYNNKTYVETMILLIDKDTKIKDASGKTISTKDLKKGMVIDVKHAAISTLSLPAQTLAYIINVCPSSNPSFDEELKDIYELLDKLFKELGVDNWKDSLKDFDFDDNDDDDLEDIIEDIVEHVLGDDYDDDEDLEDKVEDLIEKLIKEMKIGKIKNSNKKDD